MKPARPYRADWAPIQTEPETPTDWYAEILLAGACVACVLAGWALCIALTPGPTYNDDVHYRCRAAAGNPVDIKDAHGNVLAIRCDR